MDLGGGSKLEVKNGAIKIETKSTGTGNQSSSSSSSSHTDADGNTITNITTEVNGVRETRRVTVSRDGKVNVENIPNDEPPAKAAGSAKAGTSPAPPASGGWLGVHTTPLPETVRAQIDIPEGEGILIEFLATDSPAAQAGLAENDVLLKLNDTAITSVEQFRNQLGQLPAGSNLTLNYQRKGKALSTKVTLGEKPNAPEKDPAPNGTKPGKRLRLMNANGKIDTVEGENDPFEQMLNNPDIPAEMKAQIRHAQEQMKQLQSGK